MLSPKEKAEELFDKMYEQQTTSVLSRNFQAFGQAKQCAIILCNEFILHGTLKQRKYYTLVKEEIKKS